MMGWIETPAKGILGLCAGCARGAECEVAELTACKTLRDEYIRGWEEACESVLSRFEDDALLIHGPGIREVMNRWRQ